MYLSESEYQRFLLEERFIFIGIAQLVDGETHEKGAVKNYGNEKGKASYGWGERYQFRICSRNDKERKDKDLPWARRVTSLPSGQAGVQVYVPLSPGTFVEIYQNNMSKEYVIGGVINSAVCEFEKNKKGKDDKGCIPKSGFVPSRGFVAVPSGNIDGSKVVNLNGAGADCSFSESDKNFDLAKGSEYFPSSCKPFDSNAINNGLKNMKKDIEDLRNKLNGPNSALTNAENFLNEAQAKIGQFADKITGYVKWLIGYIKDLVVRGVNWALNKAKAAVPLNHRFQLQDKKTKAIDLILCLFNKILDNLSGLIEQFLTSIANRYINMATCAVEKFLTELIGQIIGQILSAVNGILNAVLGTISAIKGLIDSVLDAITSLLDFLSCDAKAECAGVTEWSFLEGAPAPGLSLDIGRITSAAKSIISSATSIVDPNNFKFNLDINSLIVGVGDACNVGPILCGPPKITFWGGGGSGATGNAIVGAAGDILGIDLVSTGFGYTKAPFVNIEDSCGRGKGATAVAVVGKVPYVPPPGIGTDGGTGTGGGTTVGTGTGTGTGTGAGIGPKPGDLVDGIVDIVVLENGFNYLKKPDGSVGGDGRTWATRCQSKIRRVDETWDYPYNPGEIMNIKAGDYIQLAGENPYISAEDISLTAPPCPPEDTVGPTSGVYPVIIELVGAEIVNPGFGYEDGDKIAVTPDKGAVLTPKFGYNGQLIGVTVESTGLGYTSIPDINIDSLNGYNAIVKPIFRVVKDANVETLKDRGVGLVNVVDCVGKPL